MLLKFVSLITLISSLAIFSLNTKNPSDPMFFIVTGGAWAGVARILLAIILVLITTIKLPGRPATKIALGIFGLPLIIMGAAGIFTNSFDFALYGLIKPLDFLLIIETGIIMEVLALESLPLPQPEARPQPAERPTLALLPADDPSLLISAFWAQMNRLGVTM